MKKKLAAFVVIIFTIVLVISFAGCTDLDKTSDVLTDDNVSEEEAEISDALTEAESNNEGSMTFEEFCDGILGLE